MLLMVLIPITTTTSITTPTCTFTTIRLSTFYKRRANIGLGFEDFLVTVLYSDQVLIFSCTVER
jgi:hypothetical protein